MKVELHDHLRIDLAEPESIAERLPQIEGLVEEKRQEAAEVQQDLETWETLLRKLKSLAGLTLHIAEPSGPNPPDPSQAAQDAVVEVVEGEGRPMLPAGVGEALKAQGHDVESPNAVHSVLVAAAKAGRLQQIDSRVFAPLGMVFQKISPMQAVPEAHLGLDGPAPKSKAEGAIRVLASDPSRRWTTLEIGREMAEQGWVSDAKSSLATLASTLSRLVAEDKIFRPERGQYQLAPPVQAES